MINLERHMRKLKDAPHIEPRITDVVGGCKRANMGKDRFYQLLHTGEIESYLDGRSRKVVLASVDTYIDKQIAQSKGSFHRARYPKRRSV
jgi:excisionase family DNA binding protein